MKMDNLTKWRLLLGKDINEKYEQTGNQLLDYALEIDESLGFIYDDESESSNSKSPIKAVKWLEDINEIFEKDIINILQDDALKKEEFKVIVTEPEVLKTIEPDINTLEVLLNFKNKIKDENLYLLKDYIKKLVKKVEKQLEVEAKVVIGGALKTKEYSPIPYLPNMDIKKTIDSNLKNYDLKRKKLIADQFYFFSNENKMNKWNIILAIDQSASMGESLIYTSILSSILASINTLNTQVIAFDTEVVNLSEDCNNDPVEILLKTALGGGTDINNAVEYSNSLVNNPSKTLFFLITDLEENGVEAKLIQNLKAMKESGVQVITLLAVTNKGKPCYNKRIAKKIISLTIPVAVVTPKKLPELIAKVIKKENVYEEEIIYLKEKE